MLDHEPLTWLLLVAGAVLVGLSKTAVPGAGTVAVALFAAVLPARQSTGALLLLLIVGDGFALAMYRRHADWRTLRGLVPTVLAGLLAGTAFLALSDNALVRRTIGVIVLALVGLTVVRRHRDRRAGRQATGRGSRSQQLSYGLLGGFTTMVANAAGPVMALYFLSSRFSVHQFLGTAAWFFAVVNLIKVPFSVGLGLMSVDVLQLDALLVPGVVVGALLGRWVVRRLSQRLFDLLVLVLTVVAGGYLVI